LSSFFVASPNNRTLSSISITYLKSYFVFDVIATLPPIIDNQDDDNVQLVKLLRFVHLGDMFKPFKMLVNLLMDKSIAKKRSNMNLLSMLFILAMIVAHIAACAWIALGT
jgi:hypothetical protein